MIDEHLKREILTSISLEGSASEENKFIKLIIASRPQGSNLVELSSGIPRIKHSVFKSFNLIIAQPPALQILSPLSIRCCLCGKIISYPAWYLHQRFAINWFHYFVCFDSRSPRLVNARCYRRI